MCPISLRCCETGDKERAESEREQVRAHTCRYQSGGEIWLNFDGGQRGVKLVRVRTRATRGRFAANYETVLFVGQKSRADQSGADGGGDCACAALRSSPGKRQAARVRERRPQLGEGAQDHESCNVRGPHEPRVSGACDLNVQGDHSRCSEPPVDIKKKVML